MKTKSLLYIILFLVTSTAYSAAETKNKAPEFPKGLEWLNTSKPFSISGLKGKIVLLDFWTYCCINCIHIMPDLRKLEDKYQEQLAVIGVHSAKFLTEQSTENIRQAILRYNIKHAVINDKEFQVWNLYKAKAWPTLILIDPEGNIVNYRSGEGVYDFFDPLINNLVQKFGDSIDKTPLTLSPETDKKTKSILNFPGKVYADAKTGRLYISDSNNNRIIISDLNGNILDVVGSGIIGNNDGPFEDAEFNNPQGVTAIGDDLYIADTDNNVIRKADLNSRTVQTIAGTGEQSYARTFERDALTIPLNSPWDLTWNQGNLFITNAGSHQVWVLNTGTGKLKLHAGSGHEDLIDDLLRNAALAQPSGITAHGKILYVADSEVSAIRSIDMIEGGEVKTLIGQGLFVFGDEDGNRRSARLQHPLGIVFVEGLLYVADTYNNKIKVLDPENKFLMTFAGTGKEGIKNGTLRDASFNEPGGISYAKRKLYIADTNNDLIRVIDIKSRIVSTLVLKNLDKLNRRKFVFNRSDYKDIVEIHNQNIKAARAVRLNLALPSGYKLNDLAPNQMRIFTEDGAYLIEQNINATDILTEITIPENYNKLYAEVAIYYCRKDDEGLCLIKDVLFEINNSSTRKLNSINLSYTLKAP